MKKRDLFFSLIFVSGFLGLSAHNEEKYIKYASTGNHYSPVVRKWEVIVAANLFNPAIVPAGAAGINEKGKWINRHGIVIENNEAN